MKVLFLTDDRSTYDYTEVPAGQRDQLITNCKQFGVDLGMRKNPDKPTDDCEADPMACQH